MTPDQHWDPKEIQRKRDIGNLFKVIFSTICDTCISMQASSESILIDCSNHYLKAISGAKREVQNNKKDI